jgi:hypothetical protein
MTPENFKFLMEEEERAALERRLEIASRDTGQSRRVANFLLAWWNASECGGFDFTDLWNVDRSIAIDMATVFAMLTVCWHYPDSLGYRSQFEALVRDWRPRL